MNYYEHHIGDYAEATSHLSFVEDAAYSRLIRKYYSVEKPLPADPKAVERLVGARTKEERDGVRTVLEEFFSLEVDGWHNKRCDEELARFFDKRAKAKRSADARWHAQPPHSERNANASGTHDERNALQTPDSRLQSPVPSPVSRSSQAPCVSTPSKGPDSTHANGSLDAHEIWMACKAAYPSGMWGGPKEILAERAIGRLLDDGIKREQLIDAAAKYCAQLTATGKVGTEFVRGPEKFYGEGFWRGPFPLPAASQASAPKARMRTAHEIAEAFDPDNTALSAP